jgi:hypothetical protein
MDWLVWTGIGAVSLLCGFGLYCLAQINDRRSRPLARYLCHRAGCWKPAAIISGRFVYAGYCPEHTPDNDPEQQPGECPDHGPLQDGRCYECEHIDLLVDTAIEQRHFRAET